MTRTLTIAMLATLVGAATPALAAGKSHAQKVSTSLAAGLCKGHGGGTSCSFDDGSHIHIVTCGEKSCWNVVYPTRKAPGGTARADRGGTPMRRN